jgi:branched-chain amino acid aminotransferase
MKTQAFPYAFFEGSVIAIEKAQVSIMTNGLQYGTGVFGGIRGYYNSEEKVLSVFRLDDHIKRFLSSINITGCGFPYTKEELKDIVLRLVQKNAPEKNTYFRPFAYVGNTNLGPNLAETTLDFALYMIPLEEYLPVSKGLSVIVSSWRRIGDNSIPSRGKFSGAYMNSALARKEAHDLGFDEAIMLSEAGYVSEGSAENIFLVRDGVLITPSPSDDILEGITRKTVMKLATDMGIPVESRTIDRSELYVSDEVFFSGTGCQIAWVKQIDKRTVGSGQIGEITEKIQKKFFNVVQGKDAAYKDWCTKIKI